MKHHLPIPAGWSLYLRQLYDRLYRQVTSPWTKLSLLLLLTILVTHEDLSFRVSLGAGNLFDWSDDSVFDDPATPAASLVAYQPERREWTAKQLEQLAYVEQYRTVALRQMRDEQIPASITLAQALLESGTGVSTLATRNNNHFGLKCFSKSCKRGHCSNHSDDSHKDFFRIFPSAEESFLAHGQLLRKGRYAKLFLLERNDYRGWARELSRAGYATDPRYPEKLIHLIESLELHRYDKVPVTGIPS